MTLGCINDNSLAIYSCAKDECNAATRMLGLTSNLLIVALLFIGMSALMLTVSF
jgi:hypothetical protein